jgi:ABC-type transport system involved in Fe-S cluster assembly, permease component
MKTETTAINIDRGKGDFFYPEAHVRDAGAGLSERTIHYIADVKEDPDWVRDFRLRALKTFWEKPLPTHWASKELEAIDFDKIRYYLSGAPNRSAAGKKYRTTLNAPSSDSAFPSRNENFLAGVEAQFDSEAVYSNIKKAVGEQGVIFVGREKGSRIIRKFSALGSAKSFRLATTNSAR